jgi:hypothetical protein
MSMCLRGLVEGEDAVEDHVDALRYPFEGRDLVVDDLGRTQTPQPVELGAAGCRGDMGAEVPGKLDGQVPDSAACGMDEDALAGAQVGNVGQGMPGGEPGQGDPRSVVMVDRGWLAGKLP